MTTEPINDDPHDWSDGVCKRCHTLYQSYLDGTSPTCKAVVRLSAFEDFVAISRRMKEIEAETPR